MSIYPDPTANPYSPPKMHDQYPFIYVSIHNGPNVRNLNGLGFWQCSPPTKDTWYASASAHVKYRAVMENAPHAVWACEDVIGFGYGSVFCSQTDMEDEKWGDEAGLYVPDLPKEITNNGE